MSDKENKNGCTAPLSFPLHPGESSLTAHDGNCPCCGPENRTATNNRPALSHFNYRIGNYTSIREFLLHKIDRTKNLRAWTHREADDPAIALLEGAAILGDILTFYQETYANEAFLRTARWRDSVADLVRLLGYRLSPGLGGKATFAFEIKKDQPITIRKGFPVKATLEGLEKPAEFETREEITAYPWLSRFNLFAPLRGSAITEQTTEFYIAGIEAPNSMVELKPGDRLIVGGSDKDNLTQPTALTGAETVIIDSIRELHGTKIYKFKGKLLQPAENFKLVAYRIGRTFRHFGHNSSATIVDTKTPITSTATPIGGDPNNGFETSSTVPDLWVPFSRPVLGNTDSTDETEDLISEIISETEEAMEAALEDFNDPFRRRDADIAVRGLRQKLAQLLARSRSGGRVAPSGVDLSELISDIFSDIEKAMKNALDESNLVQGRRDTKKAVRSLRQKLAQFFGDSKAGGRIDPSGADSNMSTESLIANMARPDPDPGNKEVPLDAEVRDLTGNVPLIIQSRAIAKSEYRTAVNTITNTTAATYTWGSISGSISLLTMAAKVCDNNNTIYIRDALFHEVTSPLIEIRPTEVEPGPRARGAILNFFGTEAEVNTLKDRRLMFQKPGAEPIFRTVSEVPATSDPEFPMLRAISLFEEVDYAEFPNENPIFTVLGNLAEADEGKTLPEVVIGSGDATLTFQNLKLPKAPLTYHIVPENTPPETPETEIYVEGRLWTKVDSFFGRGPAEKIYIVREDPEGNSWVQFGDGKTGARPNTGTDNITAVYRTGAGSFGPLEADTKVQESEKLRNLDKIHLAGEVSGGCGPENAENARKAAPGKVQGLGRIVSLQDFELEAAAIPGVVLASAAWRLVGNVPTVVITVLMETGRDGEIEEIGETMNFYNSSRGAGRNAVDIALGLRKFVTVMVQCVLKPGYRQDLVEPEIRRALGVNFSRPADEEDQSGLFGLSRQRFGGREYASSAEGVTQNVEGVLWAKTVLFQPAPRPGDARPAVIFGSTLPRPVVACESPEQILSLKNTDLTITFTVEGRR